MKAGSFISKEESKLLQGIAVCLMVFHHLFAFPERIAVPFSFVLNFSFLNIETLISYFGRICVALCAFNSGIDRPDSILFIHSPTGMNK